MSDIQALRGIQADLRQQIGATEALLALQKKNLKEVEDAIADASFQEFVSQRPDITLRRGDHLLATPEFFEHKRSIGVHSSFWSFAENGCHVEGLEEQSDGVYVRIDDNRPLAGSTFVPLAVAVQMRQAWLEQEAQA